MTNVLTVQEIDDALGSTSFGGRQDARKIEAAIIRKLAAGVSVEPEIKEAKFGGYDAYTVEQFFTTIAAARVQALDEAICALNKDGRPYSVAVVRALL